MGFFVHRREGRQAAVCMKVRISTYLVCMYVPIMSRYSIKKEAAPRDHILELSTPLSDIFIVVYFGLGPLSC